MRKTLDVKQNGILEVKAHRFSSSSRNNINSWLQAKGQDYQTTVISPTEEHIIKMHGVGELMYYSKIL